MFPVITPELHTRWLRTTPFLILGVLGVIVGGIAAAVTGPTDWSQGSWFAAFSVLVVGVAQLGIGIGQGALAPDVPEWPVVGAQCLAWNAGCALVVAGTFVESPVATTIGCVVVLATLGLAAKAAFGHSALDGSGKVALAIYRLLLVVLVVSTPVGIALSWIRN